MPRPRSKTMEALARADVSARGGHRLSRAEPTTALLVRALPGAAERYELELHYQPIVDLASGQCRRVEALVRWRHPAFGLIGAGELIRLAERTGSLVTVDQWVRREAIRQCAQWRADGLRLEVAVNVQASQLAAEQVVRELSEELAALKVSPRDLMIEIDAVDLFARGPSGPLMRLASAAGLSVALDGVTSAQGPQRGDAPNLDEIKIARSLVLRAAADPQARTDLRAIVELARELGLLTVAVGVEDRLTYDLLVELRVDAAQGFWMSRPLLPNDRRWRRWALGIVAGGALTLLGHVAVARAASDGGPRTENRTEIGGFVPSLCVLDLPYGTRAPSAPHAPTVTDLQLRTGHEFAKRTVAGSDVVVESTVSMSDRERIAKAIQRDIPQLEADLGLTFAGPPTVYVFTTRSSFASGLQAVFGVDQARAAILAVGNGGIAFPSSGVIVLNWQNVSGQRPLTIVRHELTHALVHQAIGANTVPAWFDEGLATLEERNLSGDGDERDSAVALTLLAQDQGSLRALADADNWSLRNAQLSGDGYAIAEQALSLIRQRVTPAGITQILSLTRTGGSFAGAFTQVSGESLSDFENAFAARLVLARGEPHIAQKVVGADVRFTLVGFAPSSEVEMSVDGIGYHLDYKVTTDKYGMHVGMFGSTAPAGKYELAAHAGRLATSTTLRTGN
jgi:EAL domain-containing protein (putative c-di-GMP-specific phosphodiesterase class I)